MQLKKKKNKKKKRIGEMTNSRGTWGGISPITRIKEGKKKNNDRRAVRDRIKKGDYDE
jgi:hypothetical protein